MSREPTSYEKTILENIRRQGGKVLVTKRNNDYGQPHTIYSRQDGFILNNEIVRHMIGAKLLVAEDGGL